MSGRRRIIRLLLFAVAAAGASAQAVFGGEAGLTLGSLIDPVTPLASTVSDATAFFPTLHVEDPSWRLDAKLSLAWTNGAQEVTPSLERLSLELTPADFLTVRIGRFAYLPGAGGFSSCTNWFSSLDLDSLLEGNVSDVFGAGDLLQGTLTLGDFSLTLTASPFAPAGSVPAPDSPWFPKKDFPRVLHIVFPTAQDISLTDIVLAQAAETSFTLGDMSVGAELGVSLPLVDISILAYHGHDNTTLYQPRFNFPHGFFSDYEVILTPVIRTIDAVGLDATLSWSSLSAWIDCAYTLSKTFLSKKLSAVTYSSELITLPYLQCAAGAGYDFERPRLSLQAAYHGAWAIEQTSSTILPFLDSYATARAQLRLLDDRIVLTTEALYSVVDGSMVVMGDLSFAPSSELSLGLTVPVFIGASDTELGQFAENHLVSVGVTARF